MKAVSSQRGLGEPFSFAQLRATFRHGGGTPKVPAQARVLIESLAA